MFTSLKKIIAIFGIAFCATAVFADETESKDSPWRFGAGVSAGKLTPVMIEGSVGYNSALLHIGGFGFHKAPRDFWCGFRGGFNWTFLRHMPFHINAGIGFGYEYAQAPNDMHQAVNNASKAMYLYPYNYKESLDVSAEMRIHLFGFFTQIDIPLYNFMEHDAPDMLWRIGYLVEF